MIHIVVWMLSIGLMLSVPTRVSGQNYPNKSIRIVTSEAGSLLDVVARPIAQELSASLGQPVIVDNRGSALTGELLTRSTPDGYTVALGGGSIWITPMLQKTSYDPVKDLAPVVGVSSHPYVLVVHSSVPVTSVKELIDLAKAKPGTLNIASAASLGGQSSLGAELLKARAGVNMVRVPYKGNPAALIGVLAGETQLMFNDLAQVAPHVKSGKLRALAVTSLEPFPLVPELPTVAASGLPGFELSSYGAILAPAGTPATVIDRLNREIVRYLLRADVKDKFLKNGGDEVVANSPAQLAAKIKSDIAQWSAVFKNLGVKPE